MSSVFDRGSLGSTLDAISLTVQFDALKVQLVVVWRRTKLSLPNFFGFSISFPRRHLLHLVSGTVLLRDSMSNPGSLSNLQSNSFSSVCSKSLPNLTTTGQALQPLLDFVDRRHSFSGYVLLGKKCRLDYTISDQFYSKRRPFALAYNIDTIMLK